MALLCYHRGCGLKFDAQENQENQENQEDCIFHPGVPIFHDALKGWSCCRKRTTDFSEFLSIKGCTRGCHSNEKPQEPLRPEVSSDKVEMRRTNGEEMIYRGPKSAETLQKERPSSEEPRTKLPYKVSASLAQVLEKLDISNKAEEEKKEGQEVMTGTRCKNAGCKAVFRGPETDAEVCTHHPGGPVFHEGYKYWNCCCIRTIDFNAFLDQKGCSTGKHRWVPKQDKKKVACRYDWHQTGNDVVVTIYAKNANPQLSSIEANRTVLSCQIQFENEKIFKRDFHFWGVVDVKQSSVHMVPSKVEVTLHKADQVAWGKLEDPNRKPEPEPEDESYGQTAEPDDHDIADDDISDSDEEWAYDTRQNTPQGVEKWEGPREKKGDAELLKTKEVEEEMKAALEEKRRAEEERAKLEEQRREEAGGGYEDMPELE
ncbi:cysteine and histidine-rich domain-containing protein 1 [Cyclopterus lumpus]|uniref:cysteine and histidine-rich domain-containing protein 1 n=1 Tax=Cyclopterus lumpus TaxID=8103 RepID=UPI001485C4D2|nr:cysteine and histidine-rich domain-containing protein 1 [Cyclopterus lumpus]